MVGDLGGGGAGLTPMLSLLEPQALLEVRAHVRGGLQKGTGEPGPRTPFLSPEVPRRTARPTRSCNPRTPGYPFRNSFPLALLLAQRYRSARALRAGAGTAALLRGGDEVVVRQWHKKFTAEMSATPQERQRQGWARPLGERRFLGGAKIWR